MVPLPILVRFILAGLQSLHEAAEKDALAFHDNQYTYSFGPYFANWL